ncbi:MAG: hypothetical protein KDB32_09905 [Planctomycetes bacterium]|nr:hypothetical protein [Planctomycetota bacterium]
MRIALTATVATILVLFIVSGCSKDEENYKLATSRKVERLIGDIRTYVSETSKAPKGINDLIVRGQDLSYLDESGGAEVTAYQIRKVTYEDGVLGYIEVLAESPDAPYGKLRVSWETSPERPYVYGYANGTGPVSFRYEQRRLPDSTDASVD